MAGSIISKVWHTLVDEGPGGIGRALVDKVYFRHQSIWFDLPLTDQMEVIRPKFDGWLDFDNPDKIYNWIAERNVSGTNDPHEIAHMKAAEHYFVGIMNGDKIMGYMKLGWDKVYVLDYRIELQMPAETYFVIDIFIAPENRGLGAGPFLSSASAIEMKRRGYNRAVMHVRTDKTPMLKSGAKAGYIEIGRVDYKSIFGKKIFNPHPETFLNGPNQ